MGFQFGLNGGLLSVKQNSNPGLNTGPTKFDYFVPSAGSTPLDGQHMFGNMAVWQGGVVISNFICFTDNLGLLTVFSHNNLVNKKVTINGRNDQLEFSLYYSNTEKHNIGFSINVTQNWMHFKGYTPADATAAGNFARIYPATKVSMTTIYLGVNIPIVFGD